MVMVGGFAGNQQHFGPIQGPLNKLGKGFVKTLKLQNQTLKLIKCNEAVRR